MVERQEKSHQALPIKAAKITGGVAVGAGLIWGGIQVTEAAISEAQSVIGMLPQDIQGAIVVIFLASPIWIPLTGALSARSESKPKVDMTGFSGGHIAYSASIAPTIDEESQSSSDSEES